MKLILTRHGRTLENDAGILQGNLPGTLSEKGILQIKKLAEYLKNEDINFIYSSDIGRAVNTTKEIAKYHSNVPIEFIKDLRERYISEWEGKNKKEIEFIDDLNICPKTGETQKEIFDRARSFYNQILSKHLNDTILLVGHSSINKVIISIITGNDYKEIKTNNASISIFEIDENKNCKINLLNYTEHLR